MSDSFCLLEIAINQKFYMHFTSKINSLWPIVAQKKRARNHKTIDPIKLEEARTLSPALKNLAVGLTQLGSAVQVSQELKCNALASPQKPCLRDRRVIPAR